MTSRATPGRELARRQREAMDRNTGPLVRPVGSLITAVNPRTEVITFSTTAVSPQVSTITHPYIGPSSWLRFMPQPGTSGLSVLRGDIPYQNFVAYIREEEALTRIQLTQQGEDIYRELREGEFDIMSSGIAYAHGSERGTFEIRGGLVHTKLSSDLQEIRHRAPTHRLEVLGFRHAQNKNNFRLGVVKRLSERVRTTPGAAKIEEPVRVANGDAQTYAKEFLLTFNTTDGSPQTIADVRLGHVIDDDGTEPLQGETSEKLRYRVKLGTNTNTDFVRYEVDIKGNVRLQLPQTSEEGLLLDVTNGKIRLQSAKEFRISTQDKFNTSSSDETKLRTDNKFTVEASAEARIQSSLKTTLDSIDVRLGGSNVTSPAVLGDQLLVVLQQILTALSTVPQTVPPGVPNPAFTTLMTAVQTSLSGILSLIVKLR